MNGIIYSILLFTWPLLLIIIIITMFFWGFKSKYRKYHPIFEIRNCFCVNEYYWPEIKVYRSLILRGTHILIALIRTFSPLQYMKIMFKSQLYSSNNPKGHVPAWFTEIYITIWIAYDILILNCVSVGDHIYLKVLSIILALRLLDVIYSCFYYNLFRSLFDGNKKAHNFYRSIIMIFVNYIEIIVIFSFYYRVFSNSFNKPEELLNTFNSVYFSIVTITTLGYGDIFPTDIIGKMLVSFESVIGIFILVIALGRIISYTKNPGTHFD